MNDILQNEVGSATTRALLPWPSNVGKQIGEHLYLHVSATSLLPHEWGILVEAAAHQAAISPEIHFNVIKLHRDGDEVSLLAYLDFFDDAFPSLGRSWKVSFSRETCIFRTYEESKNPPILHRKELLLNKDDSRIPLYHALTATAEELGLFAEPNRIGFREYWYSLITERGYELADGQFVPIANSSIDFPEDPVELTSGIRRHLTALVRSNFSAPIQALSRHGLIDERISLFDYGCGRGDDIRGLVANGIDATGWDPHYAPDAEKRAADVVNLGFVINVIEDFNDRIEALRGAYACAKGVLSIAAMLSSQAPPEGRPCRDGYISSRNTFQKYFTQAQLRDFIEHTLDESAIAAGPGVFFVFRDKDLEQKFLSKRYGHRAQTILSRGWVHDRPRSAPRRRLDRSTTLFEENRSLIESVWATYLDLGRPPDKDELEPELLVQIEEKLGSISKSLKLAQSRFDALEVDQARHSRTSDLLVFFALQQFQKRKAYRNLEYGLQKDIRYFFGDYTTAQATARQELFNLSNLEAIEKACRESAEKGYGWLEDGHSLQLHTSLLNRLPVILRIYVECATVLCGDIAEFDLVKIHIRSGKVTLLGYDDFEESPLPRLKRRVKVKLRDQDLDVFSYGEEYPPTLLYYKSRYINEEFPRYAEQLEFEDALDTLALHNLTGYGPSESLFLKILDDMRWQIDGFKLIRSQRIPSIDEPCGKFLTYRDLIECGETQARTKLPNLPKEPDSYTAFFELARQLLDPVIEYFGMVNLTYGFCSPALAKEIPGRIAPELDQHAAHEKKRSGNLICDRLGAACDFIVEDEDMMEVATWVANNTNVDRIYFYGADRPIHVSVSSSPARTYYSMLPNANNKIIPRRLDL
jgi:DNA phosphorothioation-associated putative methyltransferase